MAELTKYDCYQEGTKEATDTKTFVNVAGLPLEKDKASSILFGVPSTFINGIVLGDNLINKGVIEFIRKTFKDVYIVRNNGEPIYKIGDLEEIVDLRIQLIQERIVKETINQELESTKRSVANEKAQQAALWKAISQLDIPNIAKIYELIGWQGDYEKAAQQLIEEYKIETLDELSLKKTYHLICFFYI